MFNANSELLECDKILNNGTVLKPCYVKLIKLDIEAYDNNVNGDLRKASCKKNLASISDQMDHNHYSIEYDGQTLKNNMKLSNGFRRNSVETIFSDNSNSNSTIVIRSDANLFKKVSNAKKDDEDGILGWQNLSDTDVDEETEEKCANLSLTYFADKFKHDTAECDYNSDFVHRSTAAKRRMHDSDVCSNSNASTSTAELNSDLRDSGYGYRLKLTARNIERFLKSTADEPVGCDTETKQYKMEKMKYNLKPCSVILDKMDDMDLKGKRIKTELQCIEEISPQHSILHGNQGTDTGGSKLSFVNSDNEDQHNVPSSDFESKRNTGKSKKSNKFNGCNKYFEDVINQGHLSNRSETELKKNNTKRNLFPEKQPEDGDFLKLSSEKFKNDRINRNSIGKYSYKNFVNEPCSTNTFSEQTPSYLSCKVLLNKLNVDKYLEKKLRHKKSKSVDNEHDGNNTNSDVFVDLGKSECIDINNDLEFKKNLFSRTAKMRKKYSESISGSEHSYRLRIPKALGKETRIISDSEDSENFSIKPHRKGSRIRSDSEGSENFRIKSQRKVARIRSDSEGSENFSIKPQRKGARIRSGEGSEIFRIKPQRKGARIRSDSESSENFSIKPQRKGARIRSDSEGSENFRIKSQRKGARIRSDSDSSSENLNLKPQEKGARIRSKKDGSSENLNLKQRIKIATIISDSEDASENLSVKQRRKRTKIRSVNKGSYENLSLKPQKEVDFMSVIQKVARIRPDSKVCSENLNIKLQRKEARTRSDNECSSDNVILESQRKEARIRADSGGSFENSNSKLCRKMSDSEDSSKKCGLKSRKKTRIRLNSESSTENLVVKSQRNKVRMVSNSKGSSENLNSKLHRKVEMESDSEDTPENLNLRPLRKENSSSDCQASETVRTLRRHRETDGFESHSEPSSESSRMLRKSGTMKSYREDSSEDNAVSGNETEDILSETEDIENDLVSGTDHPNYQEAFKKPITNKLQNTSPDKRNKEVSISQKHLESCIESLIGENTDRISICDNSDSNCSFKSKSGEKYVVEFSDVEDVIKLNVTVNFNECDSNKNGVKLKSKLGETCRFGCNDKPFCCLQMHKIIKTVDVSNSLEKLSKEPVVKKFDENLDSDKDQSILSGKNPEESDSAISTSNASADRNCIQCFAEFSNKEDEFDHICSGKRESGFLCKYCEKIYPSQLSLQNHKRSHKRK